jgi:hypothetical protein
MDGRKELAEFKKIAKRYGIRLGLKTNDNGEKNFIFTDKKGRWFSVPYEAIVECAPIEGQVGMYARRFKKEYEARVGQYIE